MRVYEDSIICAGRVAGLLGVVVNGQERRVANYDFGKAGTKGYERISFWTKDNKRDEIVYSYGKDWSEKEIKLNFSGTDTLNGKPCFKVQCSNGHTLYIIPNGLTLTITDSNVRRVKKFKRAYEGAVNGRRTFCDVCAQDDNEAIAVIKKHFMM